MPFVYPPPGLGHPTPPPSSVRHGNRNSYHSDDDGMNWTFDPLDQYGLLQSTGPPTYQDGWNPNHQQLPLSTWTTDDEFRFAPTVAAARKTRAPTKQVMAPYFQPFEPVVFDYRTAPTYQAYGYPPQQVPPYTNWWSPYDAAAMQPIGYRAPVMHPRLVQLPERPITPHDTYRYPASHNEQIYIAPTVEGPGKTAVESAFSLWYAEQVITLMVGPGQFRPGVGGASEDVWGHAGREKAAWIRMGRTPPDYSDAWGRMGMTSAPNLPSKASRVRNLEMEPKDPWNVLWKNELRISSGLVTFIQDMIQRMTISPTAVLAAVWFLAGLGLHEGDGEKGRELRKLLMDVYWLEGEPLAVEKRIATLGLLLAGKWLDDNSFLTKSWHEVTAIPIDQINNLERAALADLHYSLFVPLGHWADHVNKIWEVLVNKDESVDDHDSIVLAIVDSLVTEARATELADRSSPLSPTAEFEPPSSAVLAAADQAISRDWGLFAKSFIHDSREGSPAVAQRATGPPADQVMLDDEDEEFLDYDGAQRWLPSASEQRRSASQSSAETSSHIEAWRSAVVPAEEPQPIAPPTPFAAQFSQKAGSTSRCRHCQCEHGQTLPSPEESRAGQSSFKETGVYLEPGISVIRPASSWTPTSKDASSRFFGLSRVGKGAADLSAYSHHYLNHALPRPIASQI